MSSRFQLSAEGLWDTERQGFVTTDREHALRMAEAMGIPTQDAAAASTEPSPAANPLAFRISEACDLAGIPKRGRIVYLAKRVGVSTATASCWLSGKHGADEGKVRLIADALGVSFQWLLLGDECEAKLDPVARLAGKIRMLPAGALDAIEQLVDVILSSAERPTRKEPYKLGRRRLVRPAP